MSDKSLYEHQRALHRRTEEVLMRVLNNEDLMAQVRASLEAIKRGERGTPFREIVAEEEEEARQRRNGG
jgi:hypothetical protein